jgi:thiamine biosynthesis lipoprotein
MSTTPSWSQSHFRAMGSHCRIVTPEAELTQLAVAMVHDLERRWSRFLPASEVSALNELDGRIGIVSAETFELVQCAERARDATGGRFNPLMLAHLERAGYDRPWSQVVDSQESIPTTPPVCTEPIELFPAIRGVRLPAGARFDPGGVGKGLAADLVTAELSRLGARTTQIEIGGDLRLAGPAWVGGPWTVRVDDSDHGTADAATVTLPGGGIATSSTVRRSWRRGDRRVHHLIDPASGRSAVTDLAAATVVAPTSWWAEVVAKVVVIAGSVDGRSLLERLGMTGVLVHGDAEDATDRYEPVAVEAAA